MLDDFFTRALLACIGVALVAGPLGCIIVWRRLAYFGDTLSHAAVLGVALAIMLDANLTISVFVVAISVSCALLVLQRRGSVSSDSLLGLMAHSALALGLVVLSFLTWVRIDLMALLLGDILAVSVNDLIMIYLGGGLVLGVLAWIWRPLFAASLSPELAAAEGLAPERVNIIFMVLMALVIAMAMKIVGVLLITALLIMPAVTARRFAAGPEQMALLAVAIGILSVFGGLFGSLHWDTPTGPSIVVAGLVLFMLSMTPLGRRQAAVRSPKGE